MHRHRLTALAASVALGAGLLAATGATPVAAAPGHAPNTSTGTKESTGGKSDADFDGDGHRDLVMLGGDDGADGRVTVVYGGSGGPDTTRKQVISQNSPGIPGNVEKGDGWGTSATSADLDGDGYTDLVVSSPGEDTDTAVDQGGLTVIWGGPSGLGEGKVYYSPLAGDSFGEHVVAGDFDADGDQDLAGSTTQAGGVVVLQGPFTRDGSHDATAFLTTERADSRVTDLVAGDIDGTDEGTDLYVIRSNYPSDKDGGGYAVFYSGASTDAFRDPDGYVYIPDGADLSGFDLHGAVGDFDNDGFDDLAVGDDFAGTRGAVHVLYGSKNGPDTFRPLGLITQNTPGVPGNEEAGDYFGRALGAGDTDGDGYDDLAVGAAGEDLGTTTDAGTVVVLRGGAGGLSGTGATAYDQDTPDITGAPEKGDAFGSSVKLTDLNGDGRADLLVSADGEQLGATPGAKVGLVHLLWSGGPGGITPTGSTSYSTVNLQLPYKRLSGPFLK
ncbi:FG-GAP repeat domain-containing protein [Streptomyces sp. NPDC050085]|uniref:FG-GAP repeat domain-containing protein n=1 Tax=Streptomyces sp. NPDC050085 TaxID=3365600 RepID=UPI0037967C4F